MEADRYKATKCANMRCWEPFQEEAVEVETAKETPAEAVQSNMLLANAYVPMQTWESPMSETQSLICGTVFAALVRPYAKGSGLGREAV